MRCAGGEPQTYCRTLVVFQSVEQRAKLALLAIEAALNRFAGLGQTVEYM
ncbi:MAG: hypothetical protein ABJE66_32520 [Deltaproteobacteria bacterium]